MNGDRDSKQDDKEEEEEWDEIGERMLIKESGKQREGCI